MTKSVFISTVFLQFFFPILSLAQDSTVFDFIDIGQRMDLISENKVFREVLLFDSPIDSLRSDAELVRIYGEDGRELSNTYLLDGKPTRTYSYDYSLIYPKVKVCTILKKDSIPKNCYDLLYSEEEGKIYKTFNNDFTSTVYQVMPPPFDLDKKFKAIVQRFVVTSFTSDSSNMKNGFPDFSLLEQSHLERHYIREETSYRYSTKGNNSVMKIKKKQWKNNKRNKENDQLKRLEFNPHSMKLSFYGFNKKSRWTLEEVKSFDASGLFLGKEVFLQSTGMRLSDNLMLKKGDHYRMEVKRTKEGLANQIHEYVNDELVFITTYKYDFYN